MSYRHKLVLRLLHPLSQGVLLVHQGLPDLGMVLEGGRCLHRGLGSVLQGRLLLVVLGLLLLGLLNLGVCALVDICIAQLLSICIL